MLDLSTHIRATLACLAAGAAFWLGDGFIAERTDAERDMNYGTFGLPDLDRDRLGRDALREKSEKTARLVGKALVAAGAVLGLWLGLRLVL